MFFFVLVIVLLAFVTYWAQRNNAQPEEDQDVDLHDQSSDYDSISSIEHQDQGQDYYSFPSFFELAAENDVNQLTRKLQSASIRGLVDIAAELNQKNDFGLTPLHVATKNNKGSSHYELIEILLENEADPNAKDNDDKTPLWYSVFFSASIEIIKLFFKFKADFTNLDGFRSSLLSLATKNCENLDVVKFLVEVVGLDVNYRSEGGMTPLHDAAYSNRIDSHYEVLKYLLEMGADLNASGVLFGETPLFYLVKEANWKVIELFLKHNADVHALTKCGSSILFAFNGDSSDVQVLQKLISDFGLDVNHKNIYQQTPLHNIVNFYSHELIKIELVKCFLFNGASINATDENGVTPLINAMSNVTEEKWFLENLDYFNFLIDQTDLSVVHVEGKHVLSEEKERFSTYYLWNWILEHLAKLKFLSIQIHPTLLKYIEDNFGCKKYFTVCIKELEVMSNTKLKNSWLTYFNLLVDSRRKLKNYAANEELIQDFEKSECLKKFPIYGALMKKNVEKGLRRRKLFDKSSIMLSVCLPIFNPNHLIIKDIFDCILSKKDLTKFCE